MFYTDKPDAALRFGDLVRGFARSTPVIKELFLGGHPPPYELQVASPRRAVVMSPCCSIGGKVLCLAPLQKIRRGFHRNPYLAEDLTNINRRMPPEKAVPPLDWRKMREEEKRKRLSAGNAYAFVELFIYEEHDLLERYEIPTRRGPIETGCYVVDFRAIYRVNCDKVNTPENAPLEAKLLQLSVETRAELRAKIADYFGRAPAEDEA